MSNSRWLRGRSTKGSALSGSGAFHFLVASRRCVHSSPSACSGRAPRGPQPGAARWAGSGGAPAWARGRSGLREECRGGLSPHEAGAQASQWLLWNWALAGPLDGGCPHPFCVVKTSYLHCLLESRGADVWGHWLSF